MKRTLSIVLTRLFLAIVFAILDASLKWEYFQWGSFRMRYLNTLIHPILLLFVVLLLLSALAHAVGELYRARKLPLVQMFVESTLRRFQTMFSRLSVQFLFWGIVVSLVTGSAWYLGILRDETFRYNQIPIPWKAPDREKSKTIRVLNFLSRDDNQIRYLENCAKIARDLKEAGAKVFLVPLPMNIFTKQEEQLIEQIHQTGIVVFGIRNEGSNIIRTLREVKGLRTGRMEANYSQPRYLFFIHRIDPFPYNKYSMWKDVHDVTFEVLRLYHGISREEPIVRHELQVALGNLKFPTDAEGTIYVGRLATPSYLLPIIAGYDMNLTEESNPQSRLEYVRPVGAGKVEQFSSLSGMTDQLKGKIIILDHMDLNGPPYFFSDPVRQAQILDDMLDGDVLRTTPLGSLLLVFLSVAGCGFILYRSKPLSATALLVLFSAAILYTEPWLFQEERILVDMPATLAALLTSIAVFVVVRLGYEWRFGVRRRATLGEGLAGLSGPVPSFDLSRRRITLSPVLGIGAIVVVVVLTAVVTSGLQKQQESQQTQPAAVYLMPPVEVQGINNSTN